MHLELFCLLSLLLDLCKCIPVLKKCIFLCQFDFPEEDESRHGSGKEKLSVLTV